MWWESNALAGGIVDTHMGNAASKTMYQRELPSPAVVESLDGLLIATQYDIPWRSDIFNKWHFYDLSRCMEFKRYGYKAVVLPQVEPLYFHDCGVSSMEGYDEDRQKFLLEYVVELAEV